MNDLMREMNGNLEDKLNNRQSGIFRLQARALQVYPSLGNYSEYFFTDSRMLAIAMLINVIIRKY